MTAPQPRSNPMTDDEVVEHYRAGTLLRELRRPATTAMQEELHIQMAALHNAKRIDLLAWSVGPGPDQTERGDGFTIQQVYRNAIPHLKMSSSDMLKLVRRIEKRIGDVAIIARGQLPLWIKSDRSRSQEIVDLARSDADIDREILQQALVGLGDETVAHSFVVPGDARKQAAIAALGAIKPRNAKSGDATLRSLVAIAKDDPDDTVRFTAIFAALDLSALRKLLTPKWTPALIDAATARPSEEIRKRASERSLAASRTVSLDRREGGALAGERRRPDLRKVGRHACRDVDRARRPHAQR